MGCGCRGGGKRNTRRTISPMSRTRPTENNTRQVRALNNVEKVDATGMTKQQRDAERKRRIQLIVAKRSGQ